MVGSGRDLTCGNIRIFSWKDWGKPLQTPLMKASFRTEIWIRDLQNKTQVCYTLTRDVSSLGWEPKTIRQEINTSLCNMLVVTSLLEDCRLTVERFARHNDAKSYAGWRTISFWYSHPYWTGQSVGTSLWSSMFGVGRVANDPTPKNCTIRNYKRGQDPHKVVLPIRK